MENINILAKDYLSVIAKFKNRYDVQNGNAVGYRDNQDPNGILRIENKPHSIGEALTTTGWCVSVSQALLNDPIFQILVTDRQAYAKLISIDIQKRFYGHCYSGTQNKWHTAILVKDSGQLLVIDLTCKQFGNFYVDKEIWDFDTWQRTFRSPTDCHVLTDFENKTLSATPLPVNAAINENLPNIVDNLQDITTMNDAERTMLARFFIQDIETINKKLICGNLNVQDFKYMKGINNCLEQLEYKLEKEQYLVQAFSNKEQAKNFLTLLLKNEFQTPMYFMLSNSIKESCDYYGINFENLKHEIIDSDETTYLVFVLTNISGSSTRNYLKNTNLIVPFGIKLKPSNEIPFYNAGDSVKDFGGNTKNYNTIMVELTM